MGELMLEFQASDEEEDRQEEVFSPISDGQIQADRAQTDLRVPKLRIPIPQIGVRNHERYDAREEKESATDRFIPKDSQEPSPLLGGIDGLEGIVTILLRSHVTNLLKWSGLDSPDE